MNTRRVARAVLLGVLSVTAAAALWGISEGRRLRAHNRRLEQRVDRLERDLAGALTERARILEMLEERVRAERQRRIRREKRLAEAVRAMPEGVRLALVAANECLRRDGFPEIRFLEARSLEDRELREVELVEHEREGLRTTFYLAGRVTLELDRAAGALVLRLREGYALRGGERTALPAEGLVLRLEHVDGPYWERRLPYLVRATGDYPREDAVRRPPPMDPATRTAWLERFERLTNAAEGALRYRVDRFSHLEDGVFREVLVLGYGKGRRMEMAVEAGRLEVEVDAEAGSVELCVRDGILRQRGGSVPLPSKGYRLLLPGLSPARASEIMLGMVKHK